MVAKWQNEKVRRALRFTDGIQPGLNLEKSTVTIFAEYSAIQQPHIGRFHAFTKKGVRRCVDQNTESSPQIVINKISKRKIFISYPQTITRRSTTAIS